MDPLDQQSPSGSGIKHSVVVDKPPKLPGHKSSGGSGGSTSSAASGNVDLRRLTLVSGDGTLVQIEEKKPSNVTPAASSADAGGGQEPPQQASYLDCVSGDVILGHANPAVTAVYASAVAQPGQGGRLTHNVARHVNNVHPETVDLTRKLMATLPEPLSVCFFVNSHSEANDLALNLAFSATGSEEVICLDNADHGRTLACLRLGFPGRALAFEKGTGNGRFGFGNKGGVSLVPTPDPFRGKYREADFHKDDIGWMYSSDVKEACQSLIRHKKRVGPLVLECMSHTSGGHVELPSVFVAEAVRTVKGFGGVAVVDETHSGLGRTGVSGPSGSPSPTAGGGLWAFQRYCGNDRSLVPDIVTVGKSLGNGHPLAAVVTTKEIAKKFMTYFSYYNYLGDPLSCAIGCAVLDQLKDGQLAANVTRVGEYLKKRLIESVSTQFNFVGQVRGLGLSLGVDIVVGTGGPNACDPNASLCHVIRNKMVKRQVMVSVCGQHKNVIGITPPFTLTCEEAEQIARKLRESMDEVVMEKKAALATAAASRTARLSQDAQAASKSASAESSDPSGVPDLPGSSSGITSRKRTTATISEEVEESELSDQAPSKRVKYDDC